MARRIILSGTQLDILARPLINIVQGYFESEINVKAYRKWHKEKYGHEPEEFSNGKSNTYRNTQRG